MSERYEFFEIIIDALSMYESKDKLFEFIEQQRKSQREFTFQQAHKEPLGSEFLRRIWDEVDPLSLVLKTHLIIENFLEEIIYNKFRYSKVLFDRGDFSFSIKVDILRAKNYLDEKLYSDIRLINNLRNKFAHDFFYDIADFDMSRFHYCDRLNDYNIKDVEVKRVVNIYVLRFVLYRLLERLTSKYPFIGKLDVKK